MISKELLTEVLGLDVILIDGFNDNNQLLFVTSGMSRIIGEDPTNCEINIYELSYKCKEWALSKGCSLLSGMDSETNLNTCFLNLGYGLTECSMDVWWDSDFTSETEEETIFKACQWIFDNKDKE